MAENWIAATNNILYKKNLHRHIVSQDLSNDELKKQHDALLQKLVKADRDDVTTKKELIEKIVKATRTLINLNMIKGVKPHQLASYINGTLERYRITYPRNQEFYNLFSDKEKRDYGTNSISTSHRNHECFFADFDDYTKKCECGTIQFCGRTYELKAPELETEEKEDVNVKTNYQSETTEEPEQIDPYSEPVPEFFTRVKYNCHDLAEVCEDLTKKYYSNKEFAMAMEKHFTRTINTLNKDQKSIEAEIIFIKKQADYRQKIGPFEKLKGIILEQTTWNIAKVAKTLSITPKHLKNNIINHTPEYMQVLQWFRTAFMKCPNCKEDIPVEMADWFNQQVVRHDLNLEMRQPIDPKSKSVLM